MRRLAACLALALLIPALPSHAGEPQADPLLYSLTVPGSGAWGLKVTTGATARFAVEIASNYVGGPYPGHVDNFGMWLYNEVRAFQFGIAIGGGVSQDRQVLRLGAGGLDSAPPGVTETIVLQGDPLDAGTMRFDIVTATPFATRYVVGWGAGMHSAGFRVWGPLDTQVAVNTGPAYAIGDAELPDGGPNVQVQKSYAQFQFVGAKAMAETSVSIAAANGAYGLWAANNFKQVCPLGFGGSSCARVDLGTQCADAGLPCDSASLSWTGPGGAGASGSRGYSLVDHRPAGTYTFTVDHKLDAYGPWRPLVGPAWAGLGEDTSVLALADVALP